MNTDLRYVLVCLWSDGVSTSSYHPDENNLRRKLRTVRLNKRAKKGSKRPTYVNRLNEVPDAFAYFVEDDGCNKPIQIEV